MKTGSTEPTPETKTTFSPRLAFFCALLVVPLALGCGTSDPATESQREQLALREELRGDLAPDRLNVILITVDTLRADRLSSYGSDVKTPNLDRLASEGVLFANTSSTVPFTFPAHSSIMTGTYPPFHGVRENVGYYLGDENRTVAETMSAAGWQTAGFVSAFVLDARWGIARGFEHYYDDFDLGAFENANLGSVQRPGSETIGAAVRWLSQRRSQPAEERPLFLWLHLFDPHDPYTPPEPFRSEYPGKPYDAEVAYTDSLVGGFLEELERLALLDTSLVVLTADHGEGLGDHGETFHGYFVYDSTVHVPLIVRFPERALAGRRIDAATSHVDIAPTILEVTGQDVPERIQGRSLLETIMLSDGQNGEAETDPAPAVYTESFYPLLHYGWAPLRALRSTTRKYIESPNPELFDFVADPGELDNLAPGDQRTARRMARALLSLADRLDEGAAASSAPDLDEQTLAQLQALGYLAGPGQADARSYDPRVPRTDPKEKAHLHRRIMLAQGLIGGDKAAEATEVLQAALNQDSNLLDAHQMLGNIKLEAEEFEAASSHFQSALALDAEHRPSLFGLATANLKLDRIEEALVGYRRLLDIVGQDSKTTLAIANIEVKRGDLAAAEEVLERAALPDAPGHLFNRLGEIRALTDSTEQALRDFETAIANNPRLSQPHFNQGVLFEELGDIARAQAEYEKAIEKAPKHYKAQLNLARLMGRLGNPERERDLLEMSIESKPDFAIGHFFLGKSLMEGNELERAEEITRAGLEIVDDSQLGWFVLADILNRRGQPAEASRAVATAQSLGEGAGS